MGNIVSIILKSGVVLNDKKDRIYDDETDQRVKITWVMGNKINLCDKGFFSKL